MISSTPSVTSGTTSSITGTIPLGVTATTNPPTSSNSKVPSSFLLIKVTGVSGGNSVSSSSGIFNTSPTSKSS